MRFVSLTSGSLQIGGVHQLVFMARAKFTTETALCVDQNWSPTLIVSPCIAVFACFRNPSSCPPMSICLHIKATKCGTAKDVPLSFDVFWILFFKSPVFQCDCSVMISSRTYCIHTTETAANKLWFVSACAENLSLSLRFHCTLKRVLNWIWQVQHMFAHKPV